MKGREVSQVDMATLEKAVATRLPEDFRSFLSKHDGAEPESNIFRINEQNDSGVNRFIPASEMVRHGTEIENVSPHVLPIAWAEGGNFVLLDTDSGDVLFWDHESADVLRIASSFGEFLSSLKPFSVDDVELKPGQVKSAWIDPDFLAGLKGGK